MYAKWLVSVVKAKRGNANVSLVSLCTNDSQVVREMTVVDDVGFRGFAKSMVGQRGFCKDDTILAKGNAGPLVSVVRFVHSVRYGCWFHSAIVQTDKSAIIDDGQVFVVLTFIWTIQTSACSGTALRAANPMDDAGVTRFDKGICLDWPKKRLCEDGHLFSQSHIVLMLSILLKTLSDERHF